MYRKKVIMSKKQASKKEFRQILSKVGDVVTSSDDEVEDSIMPTDDILQRSGLTISSGKFPL